MAPAIFQRRHGPEPTGVRVSRVQISLQRVGSVNTEESDMASDLRYERNERMGSMERGLARSPEGICFIICF